MSLVYSGVEPQPALAWQFELPRKKPFSHYQDLCTPKGVLKERYTSLERFAPPGDSWTRGTSVP